jgi:hypothetical protein
MTLIVIVCIRGGIVIASDSRRMTNATLIDDEGSEKGIPKKISIIDSDSVSKIFVTQNNIAVVPHNITETKDVLITEYVESFISEKVAEGKIEVDKVPTELLNYFKQVGERPQTFFYVCGYKKLDGKLEQQVWHIDLRNGKIERCNPPNAYGASYAGEADIIQQLTKPVAFVNKKGKIEGKPEQWPILWENVALQDAVDYAVFAIRVTAELMRFQVRTKSVGGPIDILVIKPNEAVWRQRKELHT